MDFGSLGLMPADLQLTLMETALRVLALSAIATIGATSFAYSLLWLLELGRLDSRAKSRR